MLSSCGNILNKDRDHVARRELTFEELNCILQFEDFAYEASEIEGSGQELVGQERAQTAIQTGLMQKAKGYNIFIAGDVGAGKTTFATRFAKEAAKKESKPSDWCYVYNFEDSNSPYAIEFEAGRGAAFESDMQELTELLLLEIPKAFSTEDYEKQKNSIVKSYQEKKDELMTIMSEKAKEYDFGVKYTNSGIYFMPVVEGETISEEQYDELNEEEKKEISQKSDVIQEKAGEIMRGIREIEKSTKKDIEDLEYKVGLFAVGHHISTLKEKYADSLPAISYLNQVQEDVLDNIEAFIEGETQDDDSLQNIVPWLARKNDEDITLKYQVNLFIDNAKTDGAPVIVDFYPTYYNLVGEVEYDNEFGNLVTDFMKIKPGLLHKANGGYLILQAGDILEHYHSWEAMKRMFKTGTIAIESLHEQMSGISALTLTPEPIPAKLKVILVGTHEIFDLLSYYDGDFHKYFKILAEFDYEMPANRLNFTKLSHYVTYYAKENNLLPVGRDAFLQLLFESLRRAERKDRFSTKLSKINDLLHESNMCAVEKNATMLEKKHVKEAAALAIQRASLYEEKLTEMYLDDTIRIKTEGAEVGRINGLAVMQAVQYDFAKPICITATSYLGKAGIVNIEKEADMSGNIHDKGIQVLIGYLGQTYAQDFPLSLSCRVCFEQSYSDIDGDSASSTELYVILSSLSGVAIQQGIAVTGSINQMGEIQPIGGATYKIEGFFDLCQARGLTGEQGVIIPYQNIRDLVLKDEVVEAVKNGLFHIYPIRHVHEGIEILMGRPAGKKDDNCFEANSIHAMAYDRLLAFHKKVNADVDVPESRRRYQRRNSR